MERRIADGREDFAKIDDFTNLIIKGIVPFIAGFYTLTNSVWISLLLPENAVWFTAMAACASLYALIFGLSNSALPIRRAMFTISQIPQVKIWLWIQKQKLDKKAIKIKDD